MRVEVDVDLEDFDTDELIVELEHRIEYAKDSEVEMIFDFCEKTTESIKSPDKSEPFKSL